MDPNSIQRYYQPNNGYLSKAFALKRGIRQGCPISAFIFILCAELFAQAIRADNLIEGLTIGGKEYKLQQFADDTVLVVKNVNSLSNALDVLKRYADV